MPPLTGVGERFAPRATWFCIDERTRRQVALARASSTHPCQGSILSASLAPRSWHERAGEHPDRASSSQGCADRACGSLPAPSGEATPPIRRTSLADAFWQTNDGALMWSV